MPTDNERREVVRRLREYVDLPDDWWQETRSEFYVEKCVFGNVYRHSEAELFARLADLIKPSCDRDALLALAEDVDGAADDSGGFEPLAGMLRDIARRIREACGETANGLPTSHAGGASEGTLSTQLVGAGPCPHGADAPEKN